MPIVDMPLNELKKYKGRNPKPKDHKAYWERALAQMRAVDPKVKFVRADFQTRFADCYDLYFTGVRGARLHAKFLRPKNAKRPMPAILQFHGYTGHAGEWHDKLGYAAEGFVVAALDCRGQGGSSEDAGCVKGTTYKGHIIRGLDDHPDNLLFRQIFLDTAQIARIVMGLPEVDPRRVGAMGGSQGGGLTLACISLEPRVRRAAPVFPFLSDYKRVWEMDLAKDAYDEINYFFRRFDPRHEREDEIWNKLGYIDVQHLADRIKAEVMLTVGLMDTVCPPSTQFATYNKIRSKKRLVIYPDFGHEGLPDSSDITFRFMRSL